MTQVTALPVLLVEDDPSLRQALTETLSIEGIEYVAVGCGEDALSILREQRCFAVVSDIRLPKMSGLDLLQAIRTERPELPVILMTAFADTSTAVQALKGGARDFLMKPFQAEQLIEVIHRYAPLDESAASRPQGPIAQDPLSRQLLARIERVATTDATVLLLGESGSGKEVMAQYLHQSSARATRPFIALNCAAIPSSLLEPTLFGHEKGSFTGAIKSQPGKFELAQNGTIFLDEIGELPLDLQAKLLRVLQEREVERVGSHHTINLDVRVVAATNQDLMDRTKRGQFREDLYYRINVFALRVPPLRDRPRDITPLAERFLMKYRANMGQPEARLSDRSRELMMHYAWPGNVRELENAIQRGLLMCDGRLIEPADLDLPIKSVSSQNLLEGHGEAPADSPVGGATAQLTTPQFQTPQVPAWQTPASAVAEDLLGSIDEATSSGLRQVEAQHDLRAIEREHILGVLRQVNGSRRRAVIMLGMSERTLRHKLKAWREAGYDIP